MVLDKMKPRIFISMSPRKIWIRSKPGMLDVTGHVVQDSFGICSRVGWPIVPLSAELLVTVTLNVIYGNREGRNHCLEDLCLFNGT